MHPIAYPTQEQYYLKSIPLGLGGAILTIMEAMGKAFLQTGCSWASCCPTVDDFVLLERALPKRRVAEAYWLPRTPQPF